MSIRHWLQTTDNPLLLPKAGGDGGVVAANKEVAAVAAAQGEKRKRGPYHRYGDELRAKIAKYACENGNLHAKLSPGWPLIQVNFDPIQEIGPKVGVDALSGALSGVGPLS